LLLQATAAERSYRLTGPPREQLALVATAALLRVLKIGLEERDGLPGNHLKLMRNLARFVTAGAALSAPQEEGPLLQPVSAVLSERQWVAIAFLRPSAASWFSSSSFDRSDAVVIASPQL
jgi:hypothetical protein